MKTNKEEAYRRSVQNNLMLNYDVYVFSPAERILYTILFFTAGAAVGYILYGNLFMKDGDMTIWTYISNLIVCLGGGVIVSIILFSVRKKQLIDSRKQTLRIQFREMLSALSTAYSSGENTVSAFESAFTEISAQFGESSYIACELNEMVTGMRNNHSIEKMLTDFGDRSGVEDIVDFANVFKLCHSKGGNMKYIVRNSYDLIGEKTSINEEIQTKITSNEMQLNVMSVVPILMIAFLRFSSSSFAASFATFKGVIAMTVAAALFVGSYIYGKKIIDIKG